MVAVKTTATCIWCKRAIAASDFWCSSCWKIRQARKEKPADPWSEPKDARIQRLLDVFEQKPR